MTPAPAFVAVTLTKASGVLLRRSWRTFLTGSGRIKLRKFAHLLLNLAQPICSTSRAGLFKAPAQLSTKVCRNLSRPLNMDAELKACEIRLRAERRAGQLLAEMDKAKGGRPTDKTSAAKAVVSNSPLKALGISHKQSSNWQHLAKVPEEQFERKTLEPRESAMI